MKQPVYLHPRQVRDMIKRAEREEEVIVIRCVRKSAASRPGGPDEGQLYDLHCITKPAYKPITRGGARSRRKEDSKNGILTVFVVNRKDEETGQWGAWRRVNLDQVIKVIYKTQEWEVVCHK